MTRWTSADVERAKVKVGRGRPEFSAGRGGKYKNKKVVYQGIKFDSMHERDDFIALKAREAAGEIRGLELQREFALVVNGILVCRYICDFQFDELCKDGAWRAVTADSKGYRSKEFLIKKKLMKAVYNVSIRET